jgi:predicted HicB family RNase H-like nuclease
MSLMEYKGYVAKIEFDDDAELFHGEVINTRDVITFQGSNVQELKLALRESVDDYLAFCAKRGEAPDKPFSGQFLTRMTPELHREVSLAALRTNQSVNAWVTEQLRLAVAPKKPSAPGSSKHKTAAKSSRKRP